MSTKDCRKGQNCSSVVAKGIPNEYLRRVLIFPKQNQGSSQEDDEHGCAIAEGLRLPFDEDGDGKVEEHS